MTAIPPDSVRARIEEALLGLAASERRALELAVFCGLTPEQIARRTGESAEVVRARLRTGLERLREAFGS